MKYIMRGKRIVFVMLLCGWLAPAGAALIPLDDSIFGASADGFNITRDTTASIEWLDLDLTLGMSFDQVVAAGLTTSWRRATAAEVEGLLQSANLVHPVSSQVLFDYAVNTANPMSFTDENVTLAQFETLYDLTEELVALIGQTGGNNFDRFSSTGSIADADALSPGFNASVSFGVGYATFGGAPASGCFGLGNSSGCFRRFNNIHSPLAGGGISDNSGRGDGGHFLVRDVASVPEPGTLAMFVGALLVTAFVGRRRVKMGKLSAAMLMTSII